jgi:hypothetical protein
MLALVIVASGCRNDATPPSPTPDPKPDPKPADARAADAPACTPFDLVPVSAILKDAAHGCRARVEAAYGRVVSVGVAFSGTVVSTTPARGAALFVSCQHCAGAGGSSELYDPEIDPPSVFQVKPPLSFAGKPLVPLEEQLMFVHHLYSPVPPRSAFDAKGQLSNILPKHDIVVGTLSGDIIEVVGHLGALPQAKVNDRDVPLVDPGKHAASKSPWAPATPGSLALVIGFPRDLPERAFGGEQVASLGEVLADDAARAMLARSDKEEAAIAYDPAVEMIIAARAVSGMSGGGAFDEQGRYLGVAVRGTLTPVDGKYLVRVVRAPYLAAQLSTAVATSKLGPKIAPFLP